MVRWFSCYWPRNCSHTNVCSTGYRHRKAPRQEGCPHGSSKRGPLPPSLGQGILLSIRLYAPLPMKYSFTASLHAVRTRSLTRSGLTSSFNSEILTLKPGCPSPPFLIEDQPSPYLPLSYRKGYRESSGSSIKNHRSGRHRHR